MLFSNTAPDGTPIQRHFELSEFIIGDEVVQKLQDPNNIPSAKYVGRRIEQYINSAKYNEAVEADKYYDALNTSILNKKRVWYDRAGNPHEDRLLNNTQIAHPKFRTIVNKKANLVLGKPFTPKLEKSTDNDLLKPYFNKKFHAKMCEMAKRNYRHGKDWLYVTYNTLNKLEFKIINGTNIIDTWSDIDQDELYKLDEVIWFWVDTVIDANGNSKVKKYARVFRKTGIYNYETEDGFGALVFIDALPMSVVNGQAANWSVIPFIPFKAYTSGDSLIRPLKSMIDAYDKTISENDDLIADMNNSIHVLKGYAETDLEMVTQRIHETRVICLSENGEYENVTPEIDISSSSSHLDRLNDDIYESAAAVDSNNMDLGNTSGIAIRLRYQDSINDANELITNYDMSFEMLLSFILSDIKMKTNKLIDASMVNFIFDLDLNIDEKEIVEVLEKSSYLSKKTILENHPYVNDAEQELKRIDEEKASNQSQEVQEPKTIIPASDVDKEIRE